MCSTAGANPARASCERRANARRGSRRSTIWYAGRSMAAICRRRSVGTFGARRRAMAHTQQADSRVAGSQDPRRHGGRAGDERLEAVRGRGAGASCRSATAAPRRPWPRRGPSTGAAYRTSTARPPLSPAGCRSPGQLPGASSARQRRLADAMERRRGGIRGDTLAQGPRASARDVPARLRPGHRSPRRRWWPTRTSQRWAVSPRSLRGPPSGIHATTHPCHHAPMPPRTMPPRTMRTRTLAATHAACRTRRGDATGSSAERRVDDGMPGREKESWRVPSGSSRRSAIAARWRRQRHTSCSASRAPGTSPSSPRATRFRVAHPPGERLPGLHAQWAHPRRLEAAGRASGDPPGDGWHHVPRASRNARDVRT
jgi:hypothetical protein